MFSKKRIYFVAIFFVLLIAVGFLMTIAQKRNCNGETYRLFAMDTACTITLYGSDNSCADSLKNLIEKLDNALSAYNEASAIYRANSGETVQTDSYSAEIISRAVELSEKYPQVNCTAGALIDLWDVTGDNPQVPSQSDIETALASVGWENVSLSSGILKVKNGTRLNFGSCAKGYALDVLKKSLDSTGADCAVISFGSSCLLYGEKPDGGEFTTAVADPDNPNSNVLEFTSGQCFFSTSGGYERYFEADGKRYCHIFDLSTGYPAETDLTSVTVISESDGMLTDFLSTCIFIGGTDKLEEYFSQADEAGVEIIAIDENKSIYCTSGIINSIKITADGYSTAKLGGK